MSWSSLIMAVFLYLVCTALVVAEVFIPSGGLLSVLAAASVIGGVAICFQQSPLAGWIGVGTALVLIPSVLAGAYNVFPRTRFGKAVILTPPDRPQGDAIPETAELKALVGKVLYVVKPLRPVGICDYSGHPVECVVESGYVDKGARVEVIRVQGAQLVVRVV